MESNRIKIRTFKLLTMLLICSLVLPGILRAHLTIDIRKRAKTETTAEHGRCKNHIVVDWRYLLLLMSIRSIGVLLIQLELKGLNY